jgi:hypothetical protein
MKVEPLNLSTPEVWPTKVFVSSCPIPIKVTLSKEDPFTDPPSCMLDTYMREAWEKHNLEKQDAPEDTLPTTEVDKEKMENVEVVDEPMEEEVSKMVEELKAATKEKDENITIREIVKKLCKKTETKRTEEILCEKTGEFITVGETAEPTEDTEDTEVPMEDEYRSPPTDIQKPKILTGSMIETIEKPRLPFLKLIKYPNMLFRLAIAFNYLNSADTTKDTLVVPIELDSPWTDQLREIQEKRAKRQYISVEEFNFYANHKGFIYLPNIVTIKRMLIGQRYASGCSEVEYERRNELVTLHPLYCRVCNVRHHFSTVSHPQACLTLFTNGPRLMGDLREDNSWRHDAQAVCLGVHSLLYMPLSLKHRIINIGNEIEWDYSIPRSETSLYAAPITHEMSLIGYINKVVTMLGPDIYVPIFVEYYDNPRYPGASVELHIAGFANALRYCQQKYNGPIIGLIPPALTEEGDTYEDYTRKKDRLLDKQVSANIIGQALGVPMIHIPAQITEYTESNAGICYPYWNIEPIVTDMGTPTREYFHRVENWFDYFLLNLFVNIPIPARTVGMM